MTRRTRPLLAPALAAAALLLSACAGKPAPDWASGAHAALERYQAAWLRGEDRAAQADFTTARSQLASTGRPDMVAHAELVRCAMRVASLEFDDCPGFLALAGDAGATHRAYADYLAGRRAVAGLLPEQHRAIAAAEDPAGALAAIENPASRLVAAGVLLRTARIRPEDVGIAVETASAQGWRRPLLAWLGVQERRALAAGEAQAAAEIRRRMELVTEGKVQ
jgi:hypothetical protein